MGIRGQFGKKSVLERGGWFWKWNLEVSERRNKTEQKGLNNVCESAQIFHTAASKVSVALY